MTTSSQDPTKVPVGPTSVAGWLVAGLSFAAAAVSFVTGDHTAQTTLVPGLLGVGGISHGLTLAGRYLQSHAQVRSAALEAIQFLQSQLPSAEQELQAPPEAVVPPTGG